MNVHTLPHIDPGWLASLDWGLSTRASTYEYEDHVLEAGRQGEFAICTMSVPCLCHIRAMSVPCWEVEAPITHLLPYDPIALRRGTIVKQSHIFTHVATFLSTPTAPPKSHPAVSALRPVLHSQTGASRVG